MNKEFEPTKSQNLFINNKDDFLVVSAGPGAGKTRSLVDYLDKLAPRNDFKSVLVCSFTNNSTNDIKGRFRSYSKSDNSEFINFKTFDSFLISEIWAYYFNRIINFAIRYFKVEVDTVKKQTIERVAYVDKRWSDFDNNYNKPSWIKKEISEIVEAAKNNVLNSNVVSEYLLFTYLLNHKSMWDYLISRYDRIVIDEAQDLSKLRCDILLFLNRKGMKLTFVGDERQSLYSFAGADKKLFSSLRRSDKYQITFVEINDNFRFEGINSPKNLRIKNIFNSRDESDLKKAIISSMKNQDIINTKSLASDIKTIQGDSVLVITSSNEDIKRIDIELEAAGIEHDYREHLSPGLYKNFQEIMFIENLYIYRELREGRLNSTNLNENIVQNITDYIWPGDSESNNKFLKTFWGDVPDYRETLVKVSKKMKIDNMISIYDLMVSNPHLVSQMPIKRVQVMTVHSSKGLEADYVFFPINLIRNFLAGKSFPGFQSIYVALSRAKKKIILFE